MRGLFLALIAPVALLACDGSYTASGDQAPAGGYTLEVRASENIQTFIVTAPDGAMVAAANTEVFALRFPGVDISVAADADNPNSESATVRVNAGGRSVFVDAQEGGPGDGDDRANVRITGATEEDARDFINDAEQLSDEVKTRMIAALGLE